MSGHQVRRVTQFELEIVGLRIVIDTVLTSVKQMDMFIIFHHFQYHTAPIRSAP